MQKVARSDSQTTITVDDLQTVQHFGRSVHAKRCTNRQPDVIASFTYEVQVPYRYADVHAVHYSTHRAMACLDKCCETFETRQAQRLGEAPHHPRAFGGNKLTNDTWRVWGNAGRSHESP